MIRKMRILSNNAKFSAGRPLLPACIFFGHNGIYSTYRLGCGLHKIFGDWKYAST